MVRAWVPSTRGLAVLDAGCGDGVFLAECLSGAPARIRLEDVSPRALAQAARALAGAAGEVEGAAVDVLEGDAREFDLVLAIGILDYQTDPAHALRRLAARSRGTLIATIPRAGHPRNWLRRLWLAARGLPLSLATRGEAGRLARSLGRPFEIRRCRLEWALRVEPAPSSPEQE